MGGGEREGVEEEGGGGEREVGAEDLGVELFEVGKGGG